MRVALCWKRQIHSFPFVLVGLVLVLFSLQFSSTDAFTSPRTPLLRSATRSSHFSFLSSDGIPSEVIGRISAVPSNPFWLADVIEDKSDSFSDAFTDSINYFDGPIVTMVGIFGVLVVVLLAFKALTERMDAAIVDVLVEFEATMKEFYPQRWKDLRTELTELEGEERQQKLMTIMQNLETKDPELMARVTQKMKST